MVENHYPFASGQFNPTPNPSSSSEDQSSGQNSQAQLNIVQLRLRAKVNLAQKLKLIMDPSDHLPTFVEQVKRTFAADQLGEWTNNLFDKNKFVLYWDGIGCSQQIKSVLQTNNFYIENLKMQIIDEAMFKNIMQAYYQNIGQDLQQMPKFEVVKNNQVNSNQIEASAEAQADELPNISDDESEKEVKDKEALAANKTEESIIIEDDQLYGENGILDSINNTNNNVAPQPSDFVAQTEQLPAPDAEPDSFVDLGQSKTGKKQEIDLDLLRQSAMMADVRGTNNNNNIHKQQSKDGSEIDVIDSNEDEDEQSIEISHDFSVLRDDVPVLESQSSKELEEVKVDHVSYQNEISDDVPLSESVQQEISMNEEKDIVNEEVKEQVKVEAHDSQDKPGQIQLPDVVDEQDKLIIQERHEFFCQPANKNDHDQELKEQLQKLVEEDSIVEQKQEDKKVAEEPKEVHEENNNSDQLNKNIEPIVEQQVQNDLALSSDYDPEDYGSSDDSQNDGYGISRQMNPQSMMVAIQELLQSQAQLQKQKLSESRIGQSSIDQKLAQSLYQSRVLTAQETQKLLQQGHEDFMRESWQMPSDDLSANNMLNQSKFITQHQVLTKARVNVCDNIPNPFAQKQIEVKESNQDNEQNQNQLIADADSFHSAKSHQDEEKKDSNDSFKSIEPQDNEQNQPELQVEQVEEAKQIWGDDIVKLEDQKPQPQNPYMNPYLSPNSLKRVKEQNSSPVNENIQRSAFDPAFIDEMNESQNFVDEINDQAEQQPQENPALANEWVVPEIRHDAPQEEIKVNPGKNVIRMTSSIKSHSLSPRQDLLTRSRYAFKNFGQKIKSQILEKVPIHIELMQGQDAEFYIETRRDAQKGSQLSCRWNLKNTGQYPWPENLQLYPVICDPPSKIVSTTNQTNIDSQGEAYVEINIDFPADYSEHFWVGMFKFISEPNSKQFIGPNLILFVRLTKPLPPLDNLTLERQASSTDANRLTDDQIMNFASICCDEGLGSFDRCMNVVRLINMDQFDRARTILQKVMVTEANFA